MDNMTNTDYQIQDDYNTSYMANYEYALSEFIEAIEPIKQQFEHYLDETPLCDVDFNILKTLTDSVFSMQEIALYDYEDYQGEIIEYDFTNELKKILLIDYGWEI